MCGKGQTFQKGGVIGPAGHAPFVQGVVSGSKTVSLDDVDV